MPEVKNFCPKTGVGRFNAKLEPNELQVKVKLHVKTALDADQRGAFEGRFLPLIKQHWEDQYAFRCSKPAYPDLYKPIFEIKYVDDMMKSHFVLNLLDGVGEANSSPATRTTKRRATDSNLLRQICFPGPFFQPTRAVTYCEI